MFAVLLGAVLGPVTPVAVPTQHSRVRATCCHGAGKSPAGHSPMELALDLCGLGRGQVVAPSPATKSWVTVTDNDQGPHSLETRENAFLTSP